MEWTGEALLIGVRRHGETSVIAEAMVAGRGRYMGLIRGGRSPKLAATLQPGNTVQLTWRARLEDHLGTFTVELLQARAADLIATVPERHTGNLRAGLHSFPLPLAIPEITISLLWHPRLDADPAHRWLRDCVKDVCGTRSKR